MAEIVQRFEQMVVDSGGGEGPPQQHAAPTDKEKIDWLYGVLTILDTKAGALLALDGLLLAGEILMYDKMAEELHWLRVPALGLIVFTLATAVVCLFVARVSYEFLGKIVIGTHDNSDEIDGLGIAIEGRTRLLAVAWVLSIVAVFLFIALVVIVLERIIVLGNP